MLTLFAASMMLLSSEVPATPVSAPKKQETLYCRAIINGAARSGDVKICRTKQEWAKYDACNGATRYCSPAQKRAMYGRATAFALSEDSRIVCRNMKATGSRLSTQKVCLPQREWQRMYDAARTEMSRLQDNYSKLKNGTQ